MTDQTVAIDGQDVPLDDVIWLERQPCGCIVSAAVAVVPDEWTLATAGEATRHFNRTESELRRATMNNLSMEAVTGARYRSEFAARWRCADHARPAERTTP